MNRGKNIGATKWRRGFSFQLLRSHLLVSCVGLFLLVCALLLIFDLRTKVLLLVEESSPITRASSSALAEVQHSLAGMRGWVSLGDPRLRQEWEKTWNEGILPAVSELKKYEPIFKKSQADPLFKRLLPLLEDLRESQWWVMSVAQTPGNNPALVSYALEIEPLDLTLDQLLQTMMHEVTTVPGNQERETEMHRLLEARRLLAVSYHRLHEILTDGDLQHEHEFYNGLQAVHDLLLVSAPEILFSTPEQQRLLALAVRELNTFKKISTDAISLRKSEKWDVAQYLMNTETGPLAEQVIALASDINAHFDRTMQARVEEASRLTEFAVWATIIMIGLMILIAFFLSKAQVKNLTKPIVLLANATKALECGRLDADIPVEGDDELGDLTGSFNSMRKALAETQDSLLKANLFLEQRVTKRTAELEEVNKQLHLEMEERLLAEAGLHEANTIINRSQTVAFLWKNAEGWPVEFVSDNVQKLFGYTAGEFISGKVSYSQVIHPEDLLRVGNEVTRFSENGEMEEFVHEPYRIMTSNNEIKWVDDRTQIRRDDEGRITHYQGVVADITYRMQAEEKLKKLSLAVEQSPAAVVITDKNGTIEYVNPQFTALTQYTAAEAIGQNPRILQSGRHPQHYYQKLWQTILAGQDWHGDFCNRKKNGEFFWERASIAPIKNDHGVITHFVSVKEDITAHKRMVLDLRKAKEAAEVANRTKSQFLANMSHEIRTPLNALTGFAELMADTDLTVKQRDYISKIHTSAFSLLEVINDILDFSKIEAGKLTIEAKEFDLRQTLNSIVDLFGGMLKKKGLRFMVDLAPEVPLVLLGDGMRLRQILINMIGNAIKFTTEGEIRIKIVRLDEKVDSASLQFAVSDTGIGIDPARISELFEPFTQADASTTRKYGGTGLGLTICKRLVELMGGEIIVASEPGRGSTFSFRVDFGVGSEEAAPLPLPLESGGEPGLMPPQDSAANFLRLEGLGGARILLVEDNGINLQVAREKLEKFGVVVESARNGREAVRAVEESFFDAVLMDVQMPEMDGYEATKKIRLDGRFAKLPIIAMTAHAMQEDQARCLAGGMNDFLTKPIDTSRLYATLLKWIPPKNEELPGRVGRPPDAEMSEEDDFPPELPGFDLHQGLSILGGNRKLYRKLLGEFYRENQESARDMRQAWAAGDAKGARILAHTLKGVAGNLGAQRLQRAAADLEEAVRQMDPAVMEERLAHFERDLQEVLSAIAGMEAWRQRPGPLFLQEAAPADWAAILPLLLNLQKILRKRDFAALDCFETIKAQLHRLGMAAESEELAAAIGKFNFNGALTILDAMISAVEVQMQGERK